MMFALGVLSSLLTKLYINASFQEIILVTCVQDVEKRTTPLVLLPVSISADLQLDFSRREGSGYVDFL